IRATMAAFAEKLSISDGEAPFLVCIGAQRFWYDVVDFPLAWLQCGVAAFAAHYTVDRRPADDLLFLVSGEFAAAHMCLHVFRLTLQAIVPLSPPYARAIARCDRVSRRMRRTSFSVSFEFGDASPTKIGIGESRPFLMQSCIFSVRVPRNR